MQLINIGVLLVYYWNVIVPSRHQDTSRNNIFAISDAQTLASDGEE